MTARELIRKLRQYGCTERRGKGSHIIFTAAGGHCSTMVADHPGDIPSGTLHQIDKDMAHCLGKGWIWQ